MAATHKYESISALRDSIVQSGHVNPEYFAKMFHKIPSLPTVKNRPVYLVEKSRGKVVLDIGCTGLISANIKLAAKTYYGFDKEASDGIEAVELDHRPDLMPAHEDVEVIICSEILEHLSNPGYFLLALKDKYPGRLVYFTVPNAGAYVIKDNCEIVNSEHVCWYSYQTLKSLLTRYSYEIIESRWYNGEPYKAEGIIMVAK